MTRCQAYHVNAKPRMSCGRLEGDVVFLGQWRPSARAHKITPMADAMDRRSSGGRFERPSQGTRASLLGVAACLAVLPLAAAAVLSREGTVTTIQGPRTILLPDSTRVELARDADMQYRRDFAHRRVLWLHGQAALAVAPGPPLALWTETAITRTGGATFTVRAADRESTVVSVLAGVVRLRALNEDNDPAYATVTVEAGGRAFAVRTMGARLIPP